MSRKIDVALFLIIFIALISQLFLIDRRTEPYPSILLPGSGGFMQENKLSYVEYQLKVYTTDKKATLMDIDAFLHSMPRLYRPFVLRRELGMPINPAETNPKIAEAKRYFKERIETLTGIKDPSRMEVISNKMTVDLVSRQSERETNIFHISFQKFD